MQVTLNACSSTDCCPHLPACPTSLLLTVLAYVDIYKYLVVWLDCTLSFQTHIENLQSKIKSRIGFLFCNKASFSILHAAKHSLVKLTILLILDFGDVIYKIASNTLLSNYLIPIQLLSCFAPLHPSISTCTFIFCTSITTVLIC
jgi:hypothetical protein